MDKLPTFIEARKGNWKILREGLADLSEQLILPQATPNSDPSWFGFAITVHKDAIFTRDEIVKYLEEKGIQPRTLFAGNLIKHPCFDEMRNEHNGYRKTSYLENTDMIMNNSFWIGVYSGMTGQMNEYMIQSIRSYVRSL